MLVKIFVGNFSLTFVQESTSIYELCKVLVAVAIKNIALCDVTLRSSVVY
jgi:hypothetical protein